jgi:hypothetical protein
MRHPFPINSLLPQLNFIFLLSIRESDELANMIYKERRGDRRRLP